MPFSLSDKPVLRWPLEIEHVQSQNGPCVVLRDYQGVSKQPMVLPAGLVPVVSRFDGQHSLEQILLEGKPFGLSKELLFALAEQLDKAFFLDTELVRLRLKEMKEHYRGLRVRRASQAGRVYPADGRELDKMLAALLDKVEPPEIPSLHKDRLVCAISPHIDYERGWHTYGVSCHALRQFSKPDIVIVLGTSHKPGSSLFHLTDKDYETPLGSFHVERKLVEGIVREYGRSRAFEDEILHRDEHSVELQLPFLARCWQSGPLPRLVPILVGSFHQYLLERRVPGTDEEVSCFVSALAETIREEWSCGKHVLILGGVDLAHVGRHFGDENPIVPDGLCELERKDRAFLESIRSGSSEAVFEHVLRDQDSRRICGYSVLYTMFETLKALGIEVSGRCLEYDQAVTQETDCVVSYASVYWVSEDGC